MVLTRRVPALLASLLLIAATAAAGPALAKCAAWWVYLHPVSTADQADSCVSLPCEVALSLSRGGTVTSLIAIDPDGTERYINLREVDP